MKLQCTNPECESIIGDDTPVFTVNLTVDEDGEACSSAQSVEGKYFTCCYCEGSAEWKDK